MANTTILSKVGDIKLVLGTSVPTGYVSLCDGTLVSRATYAELWTWVQSNGRTLTETEWNTQLNTYGTCAYFSTGDGSTTFRLPKINSVLYANTLAKTATYNQAVYNNQHFHGMGDCPNNQGTWGYYSYTGTYPSGTTGLFWNGKGGHTLKDAPVTKGVIITSNNISTGTTSVPSPATTNLLLCMRYTTNYQETASAASVAAAYAAADAMAASIESASTAYNVSNSLDETGWQLYDSGLLIEWGETEPGVTDGVIIFPVSYAEDTPPYLVQPTIIDPFHEIEEPVQVILGEATSTQVTYKIIGTFPSSAYLTWESTGRN